jgi:hypothetical protein
VLLNDVVTPLPRCEQRSQCRCTRLTRASQSDDASDSCAVKGDLLGHPTAVVRAVEQAVVCLAQESSEPSKQPEPWVWLWHIQSDRATLVRPVLRTHRLPWARIERARSIRPGLSGQGELFKGSSAHLWPCNGRSILWSDPLDTPDWSFSETF